MSNILTDIKADSIINANRLDDESLKITHLQAKWIAILHELNGRQRQAQNALNKVVKDRTLYYTGKASDETYQAEPLIHKVLKTDLATFLESDDAVIQAKDELYTITRDLQACELFLKDLSQRSFNIRNAIEYRKFMAGEV